MNRIEEIRKNHENKWDYLPEFESNSEMRMWGDMYRDMGVLLSKLEIAEKALERVDELDDGDPNVSLGKIAREALQQIRE